MTAELIASYCAAWLWKRVLFPVLRRGSRDLRDKFVSDINKFEMDKINDAYRKDRDGFHVVERDL